MVGRFLKEPGYRLLSCNHTCVLPQELNLNHINLLNFFCESILALKKGLGSVCEDSQDCYICLNFVWEKSHYDPPGYKLNEHTNKSRQSEFLF